MCLTIYGKSSNELQFPCEPEEKGMFAKCHLQIINCKPKIFDLCISCFKELYLTSMKSVMALCPGSDSRTKKMVPFSRDILS